MDDDAPLERLRNLGPVSCEWLHQAGINSIGELKRLGPVTAYQIVKGIHPRASLNLLWALAAGLEDKDWRKLTAATKARLRKAANET